MVPVEVSPSMTLVKVTDDGEDGQPEGDGLEILAGKAVYWTYRLTNDGNVTLKVLLNSSPLVDDNGTPDIDSDDLLPEYDSGDENDDGELDVGETWTFTQSGVAAAGNYANQATATMMFNDTPVTATDDSSYFGMDPVIAIDKITGDGPGGIADGDGVQLIAGSAVTWTYSVSNAGNVPLTGITVSDDNGTPGTTGDDFAPAYSSGDANDDGALDAGEIWIFTASGTAIAGDYENLATATGQYADISVTDDDKSSYFGYSHDALIAPTGTTPQQYISGTAMTFQDYYADQGGVIQYSVKSGKIGQTNPGVFFYFTGAAGNIKDGNNNQVIDNVEIRVDQSRSVSGIAPFYPINNSNIKLYKVIDDGDGVVDSGDTLVAAQPLSLSIVKNASSPNFGDLTVTFKPDAEGTMYVLSVKYSTASALGASVGTSPALWPTSHYGFSSYVNGTFSETYGDGIDLAPKPASLMVLAGDEGDGAHAIRAAQTKAAYSAALSWWEGNGFDVSALKQQAVRVAELGVDADGNWVLGMAHDGHITIDDDAANHGWSLGVGNVVHDKVDLLSVLVHEVGHLLEQTDEQMGDSLDVGVRQLPTLDGPLGLVGMMPELPSPSYFG